MVPLCALAAILVVVAYHMRRAAAPFELAREIVGVS